jgi:hypothetical protein
MIKFLSMLIGLLLLAIAGLGVMVWASGNQTIDPHSQEGRNYAQSFKSSIKGTCKSYVRSALGALTRHEEVQEVVLDICDCAADMTYDAFKNEPPITLISIVNDSKTQAKAKHIIQECLDRAEIPSEAELLQSADAEE